ncbi:MAG: hypothetical protein P1P93_08725 [Gammaproteobacteria bacterium]|nr:hypothetical protein [Gammaproteobacteria bacterium]
MSNNNQIQNFQTSDGQVQLDVALQDETVWLSQAQMADLFGTKRPAVIKHLSNIFKSSELSEETTSSILEHVADHGQHSLADGNKRSGSFLFLWYLRLNQHLLAKPVEQLINDNTLVALALLVAESVPEQKALMIRLIEHFILLRKL